MRPYSLRAFLRDVFIVGRRVVVAYLLFATLMVSTQTFQLFPEIVTTWFRSRESLEAPPPPGVERFMIPTGDGETLEAWRTAPQRSRRVALLFHGNAGTVRQFYSYQRWLRTLGVTSYDFDYRGFGLSTGWPSEERMYRDAETVADFIIRREKIDPADLVLVTVSVGTGAGAYLAARLHSRYLVLFTPYRSLRGLVSEMPLLGHLSRFLSFDFPVEEHLARTDPHCAILIHGERDTTIPVRHTRKLGARFPNQERVRLIIDPEAGHNDVFTRSLSEVSEAMRGCGIAVDSANEAAASNASP